MLFATAAASLSLLPQPLPAGRPVMQQQSAGWTPPLPAGRSPPPLMQTTDTGGAAVRIRGFDVWAGSSPLMIGVDWTIMPNERWALLGGNGCGKSTLLRAIGEAALGEVFEGGALQVSSALRFGMLEQTAVSGATSSVRDEVMSRMGPFQAAKGALEAAEAACTSGSVRELEALERAQAGFEAAGGYAVNATVARVLKGLGFSDAEFDRPCASFSGGWQMRIGLARLLLSDPEILMLDEPTNHLDAAARRWLGEYVGAYPGTVLVVSHDAEFVAAAADSIADVAGGRVELYKSVPYSKFISERTERQQRAVATVEAQEREARRLQDFIDRMGAKASKAKQAKDRQGKLDRLDAQMAAARQLIVGERHQPKLTLAQPPACGELPLELLGATLRHPQGSQPILEGLSLQVSRGMRLVVRGPNGAGKSTLLRALSGQLPLEAGERRTDEERLRLGVFAQDLAQELPQELTALEYVADTVRERDSSINDEACRNVMGALGLVGDKALRRIGDLSGGEKARVALATFCLTPNNVVLFDEPSNHLDAESIAALLQALEAYEGAVVVISHDRAFCEAMRCSHVAYVANGRVALEERSLRPSDFSEEDRGVANVAADAAGGGGLSMEERAAFREVEKAEAAEERRQQKRRSAAPKKLAQLEASISEAEAQLEALADQTLALTHTPNPYLNLYLAARCARQDPNPYP